MTNETDTIIRRKSLACIKMMCKQLNMFKMTMLQGKITSCNWFFFVMFKSKNKNKSKSSILLVRILLKLKKCIYKKRIEDITTYVQSNSNALVEHLFLFIFKTFPKPLSLKPSQNHKNSYDVSLTTK